MIGDHLRGMPQPEGSAVSCGAPLVSTWTPAVLHGKPFCVLASSATLVFSAAQSA